SPVVCSSAPSQTGELLSVSQLVSQQHLACVSNLSWSTNQQRAWAREAELAVPGQRALPRVNLLLIGCLREGPDGEYRLTDASGSVMCECLSLSPLWLDRPVFLPHWNYIPHNASGQEEAAGFLELIGSPVLLCPGAEQGLAAAPGRVELSGAVGVGEAGRLLSGVSEQCVGSVCPLLAVAGTTFFCFTLTDESRSLPVRLSWIQRVCVGQSVCVTALRVCALRGWRGNNILCVTKRSELHADYTHTQEHTQEHTHSESLLSQPAEDDCEEAEHEEVELDQSAVRIKQSKVISYQGTVTEVVSEGAGLYVLDGKVGLCVAYQPAAKRKLRAGDRVELHHAHFLYRPCPDFPPSMLCTCLRSSLRVTTFSRAGGSPPDNRCPGDGALPRLLLQRNTDVSDYLWTCSTHHHLSTVRDSRCVCLLSWRLMETLSRAGGRGRRDIYAEMLDEPHTCPVTMLSVLCVPAVQRVLGGPAVPRCVGAPGVPADWLLVVDQRRPLLLVGLLELPSQTSEFKHSMQLRDAAGAAACVLTESSEEEEGAQRAVFNSAWIGCLVGVVQFTMVTERFLQSDFPSYQHLDQDRFITHKHCRVYLQFSLDHLHILSPSVAMETHLRHKGKEPGGDVTARKQTVEEEEETAGSKRRRRGEEEANSGNPWPCVSMVIRVEQEEGVSWRNTGAEAEDQEAGLRLCFSVKAAVIGPVVSWRRDPKNDYVCVSVCVQVVLVFSGVCTRWFPVLQPGCFYRLIAANTQDPSVLIGCGVSERSGVDLHAESTLQVRRGWRFHTLTRPLLFIYLDRDLDPPMFNTKSRPWLRTCAVYLCVCFRTGSVYCTYLPVSSITSGSRVCRAVPPPPAPIMHLGEWALSSKQRCAVGQVKGHVMCFLFLQLQWSCSLCGSVYTQGCSSSQCHSTSSVFQSKAKLVIDDGTGEAHVCFSAALVRALLGLADAQWEGLQRALRVRGHIRVFPRGQSQVCDEDADDFLLHFLLCLCSSDVMIRPLSLTCRKHTNQRPEGNPTLTTLTQHDCNLQSRVCFRGEEVHSRRQRVPDQTGSSPSTHLSAPPP
uniref:CST complex subunit CTC1 n=1 Tax=Maylandia zebra TaxID=106582 RepID=A0A3P9B6E1_9CICH